MKKLLTGDVWLLRSYRYWIDDYEYEYIDSQLKGETRYYRFRPIAGGRRKAEVVISQNNLLHRNIFYEDPEQITMGHGHKLSVIRRERSDGIAVYTASLYWAFVAQFFSFDDTSLPPEERANRALITAHAKKIERYILDNPKFYLPPMIVAVNFDGSEKFTPLDPDFPNGLLEVPFNCLWQIIDGQHRTYAMQQIFKGKRKDDFKNEMINVDIIINAPLELRQRIFYETNSLGKSVSRKLTTVYRDNPNTIFANTVLRSLPLLSDDLLVEKEKSSSPLALVAKLQNVDWSKTNPDWLYRVVDENGGMLSRRHNVKLMLIYLKLKIGTPLKSFTQDEQELEKFHIGKQIGA